MNDTKREFILIFGFAAFILGLSIFLWLGSTEDIQYWGAFIVIPAYPSSVVGIFIIRIYVYCANLAEMEAGTRGKRFNSRVILLISNTFAVMLVELATLTWIFASFFAVGGATETDTYRHLHPFEQFSTYAVIPYLAAVVHFMLKSLKKGSEITPIGIRIIHS